MRNIRDIMSYPTFLADYALDLRNIETSIRSYNTTSNVNVIIDKEKHIVQLLSPNPAYSIKYVPEPTPLLFHQDRSKVRLMMGPYGSGKTSASIAEIIQLAAEMPMCIDGVRHIRGAIVRNTYAELETTTLSSWDNWTGNCFETVSRHKKPIIQVTQRFRDERGIVEIDLLFLALDRPEDLKKIKSLEVTFVFINEACEIPFSLISHLLGRTGRYPSEQMLATKEMYWHGIIADTNPPDTDHAIYHIFEEKKPIGYKIFKQPPALLKQEDGKYIINPLAENISHYTQGANYYLDMVPGATEEFLKVYAMGQYGMVLTGKPVYSQYNDDVHSVDDIKPVEGKPITISWDFGLTPAALIAQQINGQLRAIKEFTTENMGLTELAETIVLPYLRTTFAGYAVTSTCDPSGSKRNDGDAKSCIQILDELGLETFGATTNNIIARVDGVKFYFSRMINGAPALLISRLGCPMLRKGFLGKYCYKRKALIGTEEYRDLPDKTHPFSDIQDCLQYIALAYNGNLVNNDKKEKFNAKDWLDNSRSQWV